MSAVTDSLPGKVVLVTGASSGLGTAFCQSLAANGCDVVCAARRAERLQSLCHELNRRAEEDKTGLSGKAAMVELDVTGSEASIAAAVAQAWSKFGRIDVLVNNAGVRGTVAGPLEADSGEWDTVMATNAKSTMLMVKAVGRLMRDSPSASKAPRSIINISSVAALPRGKVVGGLIYASSKGAVHQMTEVMAQELGKYNIRINAVAPGLFRSEITEGLYHKDWLPRVATKIVPLRRWGQTDPDLTSLILYLASDASAYVTGNVFIVDGGSTVPGYLFSAL